MLLEKFCDRLVVLSPRASAYEAARAMNDNHVGAVLVKDRGALLGIVTDRDLAVRVVAPNFPPGRMPLEHVMSREVATIAASDTTAQAAALMHALGVRRLVVVDGAGRAAGVVTLDDLILSGTVAPEALRGVVFAQLSQAAREKPAGFTRPTAVHLDPDQPQARSRQHRSQTLRAFGRRLKKITRLTQEAEALAAFEVVAANLMLRLQPEAARHLLAELPAALAPALNRYARGPDRRVTRATIARDLSRRLHLGPAEAAEVLARIARSLDGLVSHGQVTHLLGQLPAGLRPLFHHAA